MLPNRIIFEFELVNGTNLPLPVKLRGIPRAIVAKLDADGNPVVGKLLACAP